MNTPALNPLRQRWQALSERERLMVGAGGAALAFLLLWWLAVQPVIQTWRTVPAARQALELQALDMQRLASEARELKGQAPVSHAQAVQALQAATGRLGAQGRLSVQGDRATLTLTQASPAQLRHWLDEARQGARARPTDLQLSRDDAGLTGQLVVALPATP